MQPDSQDQKMRRVYELLQERSMALADRHIQSLNLSPLQELFVLCQHKTAVILGANRSGKTLALAIDVLIRALGILPESLKDKYPKTSMRVGEYWLSGLDFPSITDVLHKKVEEFLPKSMDAGYNKEFKKWMFTTGSELGFKSAESGREKYQGTSKVYVGHDEEPPEPVRDEAYMRAVDCAGVERFAFTPLKGMSWAYHELYKKAGKYVYSKCRHKDVGEGIGQVHTQEEIEKLKDREIITVENSSPEADQDIIIFQMTIYDNVHLPNVEIHKAEKKHQYDPAQYNARILGNFAKATGSEVFNVKLLEERKPKCPRKVLHGEVEDTGQFKINSRGNLTLYRDLKDIKNHHYVIGADVSEGLPEGDYSCAQVLDHKTGEQVAKWHGKVNPEEFARVLNNIGRWFNNAYLAPEINFLGIGVLSLLRTKYNYPRLYYSTKREDDVRKKNGRVVKTYGWKTDGTSKPIMITDLSEDINNNCIIINDVNTIEELCTYARLGANKMGGLSGCTDDEVIALAIANQVRRLKRPFNGSSGITTYPS